MPDRKLIIEEVTLDLMALYLKLNDKTPDDVRVLEVFRDHDNIRNGTVSLICESKEYKPVAEGSSIPRDGGATNTSRITNLNGSVKSLSG